MSHIDLLINQIIDRAQKTAEGFKGYPAEIDRELIETHLTKEEFIRSKIKEVASSDQLLAKWYNVRNINHLRLVLFMNINTGDWPPAGSAQFTRPGRHKMFWRQLHSILWPLFLRMNRIDYLRGLLEPTSNEKKLIGLPCQDKYNEVDLKFIYSKLMEFRKLHKTVTETNFVGAFQSAPLSCKIKWVGNNSELATLVYELTNITPEPLLINSLFDPKYIYDSVSTKRITQKNINKIVKSALI